MSRTTPLLAAGCLGLLLGPDTRADAWYANGAYGPTVRVGVDVVWGGGGIGYAPPPPVVWYPAPAYGYAPPPRHGRAPRYAYGPPPRYVYGPPPGRGWRKHDHRHRDWERCDD